MAYEEIGSVLYLVRCCVFDDLRAQVAAGDRSEVLLVALSVACILVHHVGRTGFRLRRDDLVPELLSLNCLPSTTFLLIPEIMDLITNDM